MSVPSRHRFLLVVVCLMASGLRLPFADADDWPQWRGPQRDGVWREEAVLKTFPAEGFQVRWRAAVGPGWATPVIAAGRVFVTDAEMKKPRAWERVRCFDAASGGVLWSYAYEVTYPERAFSGENSNGPTATPVVADGKVYALGGSGEAMCLAAATGELLWRKDLGKEFEVALLTADAVYSATNVGDLVCLDARTGQELWRVDQVTDRKSGASIHFAPNGDAVFLYTDRGELIRARLRPAGYEEISRTQLLEPLFPFGGRKLAWSPPAYANRHVFVPNERELICASLAVDER